jgi:transglutaminase-like putative cysteine protease
MRAFPAVQIEINGVEMPIFVIRHITTYRYRMPVAFGEHRMMLRPRDDADQRILDSDIKITPAPSRMSWTRDAFGNHVATAHFKKRASILRFESAIRLHHSPTEFHASDIADYAQAHPFAYGEADRRRLADSLVPLSPHAELDRWIEEFLRSNRPTTTYALLVTMTKAIQSSIGHVSRHEKGIQTPAATLALGTGCCRDRAVLMIAALRRIGIAARFVSGYQELSDEDDADDIVDGNTHAWAQAFIPGPGWVDVDPSSGIVGNRGLVRVAIVHDPRDALPLQGTWIGSATDHLAMKVGVRMSEAPGLVAPVLTCAA